QPPVHDQEAFCDGLFRRCQQTLIEPYGVCTGNLIEAGGYFAGIESAAKHLGSQQPDAGADRTGYEYFQNPSAVMIYGYEEVLVLETNTPCRTFQFGRTFYPFAACLPLNRLRTDVGCG
ncbi:hypothetical protein OFM13_27910, partial [Escherichia coli]|nr:hypothetical protein [Escherichia coli]